MLRYITAALLVEATRAWWCTGHMLTANVALECGIMSSKTIDAATAAVEEIASYYSQSPDFVSSACWADDLKSMAATQESNWHFIDIPVIRTPYSGTPTNPGYTDTVPWAINSAQTTIYSTKSTDLDKSRQIRFMIHFVGDIHQPLHAAALFSDQFPNGDMGGNLYPIVLPGSDQYTNELHAVCDAGAGQWIDDIVRPINSTGKTWLDDFSKKVMTAFPKDDPSIAPLIKEYNTSTWANESNAIANDVAYTAPQAPTVIPQSYIDNAQTVCQKQIAVGGYRLADLLEYIFTSTEWGRDYADRVEARKKNKATLRKDNNKANHHNLRYRNDDNRVYSREELERPELRK